MIAAVLDTPTLIAGLGWHQAPARKVVNAALAGRFVPVTSPELLEELEGALARPELGGVKSDIAGVLTNRFLHVPTGRVLLRWHERMGSWLQVGGHADPGEDDPAAIARREAAEETGLDDLAHFPDPGADRLVHVVVVPVPAGKGEPAHEHADLRYLLATEHPDDVVPESATASLRWLSLDAARSVVQEDNLRVTLARAGVTLQLRSGA